MIFRRCIQCNKIVDLAWGKPNNAFCSLTCEINHGFWILERFPAIAQHIRSATPQDGEAK